MSNSQEILIKSVQIGDRLRQARTSAGLEISDIATDLRINAEYIEALELNQFEVIGAPTYVKGYLRNYANALKLSPEALVEEYESLGYDAPELQAVSPLELSGGSNRLLNLFSMLVVFVTLGLFIYWLANSGYTSSYSARSESVEYTEPKPTIQTASDATRIPLVQVEQAGAVAGVEASANDDLLSMPLVEESPSVESISSEPMIPESEFIDDVALAPEAGAAEVISAEVNGSSGRVFSEEDFISALGGDDEVLVSLTDESWIEIEDAAHFQLMKGVYPAGTSKILRGEAPFQVFLGFAPGVEIIFNDSVYQTEPHRRANNTAKFALIY